MVAPIEVKGLLVFVTALASRMSAFVWSGAVGINLIAKASWGERDAGFRVWQLDFTGFYRTCGGLRPPGDLSPGGRHIKKYSIALGIRYKHPFNLVWALAPIAGKENAL